MTTTYYILKDDEIVLYDTNKTNIENTLEFMPQYSDCEILETEREIENFQFADTEEYIAQKAEEERERLDSLSLTAADVERAIYKAKGMDFDDIVETVEAMNEAGTADIDIKALKIELKANNFYRGNDYVTQIGTLLGYSSDDLDYLFENGEILDGQ